jgi:hypothetical protein
MVAPRSRPKTNLEDMNECIDKDVLPIIYAVTIVIKLRGRLHPTSNSAPS